MLGSHSPFNYRKKSQGINRDKIFLQDEIQKGLKKYYYTGWSYRTALATKAVYLVPQLHTFVKDVNSKLSSPHDHWIGTIYNDGDDSIDFHHDKMVDIDPDSWIIVWRLGGERTWQLRDAQGQIQDFTVEGGDAIFMNAIGNAAVEHGISMQAKAQLSGSIVGRAIKSKSIPWSQVLKRAGRDIVELEGAF